MLSTAWERAWGSIEGFDVRRPMAPWLLTILDNVARELHRKRRGGGTCAIESAVDPVWLDGQSGPRLGDVVGARLALQRALDELPARQRVAFIAVYVEGADRVVVAQQLALNRNGLDQLLHRARTALRTALLAEADAVV